MKKNVGNADSIIRILFFIVVVALYFTDTITGTTAIIIGLFAIIFLVTGIAKFCPLYWPFKISTVKKNNS